jgi:hypothetical protein
MTMTDQLLKVLAAATTSQLASAEKKSMRAKSESHLNRKLRGNRRGGAIDDSRLAILQLIAISGSCKNSGSDV